MAYDYTDLRKNTDNFSFSDTSRGMIVNREFSDMAKDPKSVVFSNLSAIADDIGQVIYENVVNYIDNIGNVDTCKVDGLGAQCRLLAINYEVMDRIKKFPSQIRDMLDIFSISPSYLISTDFFAGTEFSEKFVSGVTQQRYEQVISSYFYSVISAGITQKYVECTEDVLSRVSSIAPDFDNVENYVYKNISAELFEMDDDNPIKQSIISSKNIYGVPQGFDHVKIATDIENGNDSIDGYSEGQRAILEMELANRKETAYSKRFGGRLSFLPQSRYAWYKEREVKDFIQFALTNSSKLDEDFTIYSFDNRYVLLSDDSEINTLIKSDLQLNSTVITKCATNMTKLATQLCQLRYKMKEVPQKYFIRGSFLLLSHLINDMLFRQFGISGSVVDVQEYYDTTEYFNLKTDTTPNARLRGYANKPYFQSISKNGLIDIDRFYEKSVEHNYGNGNLSTDFDEFLTTVYGYGASRSYVDWRTFELCANGDTNRQIALKYFGNSIGYQPWLNLKNRTHPSYQIHPCLYNFVKYANVQQIIKHTFDSVMNDEYSVKIVNDLSNYVGSFGNTLSAWNNGVDEFFGYNSRYENSPNRTQSGLKRPFADFDGLFYDRAYREFRVNSNEFVSQIRQRSGQYYNAYYRHFHYSENEAKYYSDVLSLSKADLTALSSANRISQYALDMYHGCYSLVNNRLWLRPDDNVLPFPFRNIVSCDTTASFNNINKIDFNKDSNVLMFWDNNGIYAGTINRKYNDQKPKFYQYYLENVKKFTLTGSCGTVKYGNSIGLVAIENNKMELELYDFNSSEKLMRISCGVNAPNGFMVHTDLDSIQIAYVSSFSAEDAYPYYMKNTNNAGVTGFLNGTKIVVDTYSIIDKKMIYKSGTQYFSEFNCENGLIPLIKGCRYDIPDAEPRFFQLCGDCENKTLSDMTFPYGRMTRYSDYVTDLVLARGEQCYISSMAGLSTSSTDDKIPTWNVKAVYGNYLGTGLLAYELNSESSVLVTNVPTLFKTVDDEFGNSQYAVSAVASQCYIRQFEGNLSDVTKCSEQDWTKYYDINWENKGLCIETPKDSMYKPSGQFLIGNDGAVLSIWFGKDHTIYVNYRYSYVDTGNDEIPPDQLSCKELPYDRYLKLQPGMGGNVYDTIRGEHGSRTVRTYVKNISYDNVCAVAVSKIV